jgi:hypothetical protein
VGGGGPRPEEARAAVATGGATGRSGVQAASRVAIGGWSSVGRDGARQPQAVEGGGGGRARAVVEAGGRRAVPGVVWWQLGLDWSRAWKSGSAGRRSRKKLAIFGGPISFGGPVGKTPPKVRFWVAQQKKPSKVSVFSAA